MSADRDRAIVETMKHGLTREASALLYDLSKHAFERGWDAVLTVVRTAPSGLQRPIMASVLGSFGAAMRDGFPEHWLALKDSATSSEQATVILLPEQKEAQS